MTFFLQNLAVVLFWIGVIGGGLALLAWLGDVSHVDGSDTDDVDSPRPEHRSS